MIRKNLYHLADVTQVDYGTVLHF